MITLSCPVDLYFMPDDRDAALARILGVIANAKTYYHEAIYEFGDVAYAQALLAAHQRGVDVKILTDHIQSSGKNQKQLLLDLIAQGFPRENIAITTSAFGKIMHDKMGICDDGVLLEGSLNWSADALKQDNTMAVFFSADLAKAAEGKFQAHWAWTLAHDAAFQIGTNNA